MPKLVSTRAALAAAALMGSMPLAFAQSDAPNGNTTSEPATRSQEIGRAPAADVKPFESAKLSLVQAISSAQREMRGKTLEARFELWHGKPVYLVRTYTNGQVWESRIDADSGQPIGQPRSIPKSELSSRLQRDVAALDRVQTDVADAVSKAEQQDGGKAMMVGVNEQSNGDAAYRMELVTDGRLRTAVVDAQNGQLR